MHKKINELIRGQNICVLATSRDNVPHASLMAFTASDDCSMFFMATYRETAKFANIQANPAVSLLLDNRGDPSAADRSQAMALTVHGQAEVISQPAEHEAILAGLRAKAPHLSDFLQSKDIALIRVTAQSMLLIQGPTQILHQTTTG
jgi:nitroimidazol reductase NimA-like FMN-containing flavoprotein (pyridoxamine 5'-phosphate oxidase superfamily)